MPEMKLKIHTREGFRLLAAGKPGERSSIFYTAPYGDGDFILLETDGRWKHFIVQLDDAMPEVLVYVPGNRMAFHIPPAGERGCFSPKSFSGACHLIRARAATAEEIGHRRNLALNPYDQPREGGFFPHASSNVEGQKPEFTARNAIDGIFENNSHGGWPFQAWGIGKESDPMLRVDFGREVTVDEVRLTLRADFPHDSWWRSAVVVFSDGTKEYLELARTGKPQSFQVSARTVQWVELKELRKYEDDSLFPALTQLEVWGTEQVPAE